MQRHETHGLFGGYLLLSTTARPLEFHCTAPVKPSRAQEILYGPTLEPYLYGEQIGRTLVTSSSLRPLAVLTDVNSAMALRDFIDMPMALVEPLPPEVPIERADEALQSTGGPTWRLDAAHAPEETLKPHVRFTLGPARLTVSPFHADDRSELTEQLGPLAEYFDLAEPFGRIHAALEEAQRARR